jgi:NAD-dependent deacetylase
MISNLQILADRIKGARSVTALTGAGVSAASGIPTFRGAHGLWRTHRAEDLATPEAFIRNPTLVWEWYDWRRSLIASCDPNAAHEVLARWSALEGFTLITQNVDGLHERAGATPLRLHGSIWELRCADGCGAAPWDDRRAPLPDLPPRCPSCRALARPGVVWFGEALDPHVLDRAAAATGCDVFLSIGTSSVVYPAAGLVHDARRRGAFTAEINPVATDASGAVDLPIAMPAEDALPAIERLIDGPPTSDRLATSDRRASDGPATND